MDDGIGMFEGIESNSEGITRMPACLRVLKVKTRSFVYLRRLDYVAGLELPMTLTSVYNCTMKIFTL